MKRNVFLLGIWILLLGLSARQAHAITYYGGNGLVRVMSANNVYQGDLWASANLHYGKTDGTYVYRDGTITFNLLYGIRHYLEIGANQTIYQDRALTGDGPAAGPLRISIKSVIPRGAPSSLNLGGQLLFSIPVGTAYNVEYESYISPKTSFGGMAILSIDSNPVDLRRSRRVHINFGFYFHNDKSEFGGQDNTTQYLIGLGVQFPISNSTMFFTEISGERFIRYNPEIIVSREAAGLASDYYRLTPGVRQQFRRMILQTGLDIRPNSVGTYIELDNQPLYPRWKIFFNLQFRLMEGIPPTYRRGKSMRISGRSYYQYGRRGTTDARGVGTGVIQNVEERQELLDQIEQDLQEIREQRIKAQRELEELKKSLEPQSP